MEVAEPEMTESEVLEPEVRKPDALRPEVLEPEVQEPEVLGPEVLEQEAREPVVLEPEDARHEVLQPEMIEPKVLEPKEIEQEVIKPEVLEPEVIDPESISKTVSLVYANHRHTLVEGLWRYFRENRGVDFEVACEGHSIRAHQVVLSLFVPTIGDALQSDTVPESADPEQEKCSTKKKLDIGHLVSSSSDLEVLIEFVYRGVVTVSESQLESLLKTADVLGIAALSDAIEEMRQQAASESEPPVATVSKIGGGGGRRRKRKRTPVKLPVTSSGAGSAKPTGRRVGRPRLVRPERNEAPPADKTGASGSDGDNGRAADESVEADNDADYDGGIGATRSSRRTRTLPKRRAALIADPDEDGDGDVVRRSVYDENAASNSSDDEKSFVQSLACLAAVETCEDDGDQDGDRLSAACLASADCDDSPDDDGSDDASGTRGSAKLKSTRTTWRRRMVGRPRKNDGSVVRDPSARRLRYPRRLRRGALHADRNLTVTANEYKKLWRQSQPLLKCTQCSYETRDKVTFKSHAARHDPTVALYQCKTCDKRFRSKKGFALHEQSHSGVTESFQCPHCESVFTQRGSLSRHVTGVHKIDGKGQPLEKNHRCPDCDFSCQYSSLLKLHVMRKHSPVKPFKCTQCPHYSTVLKSDLEKHISIVHLKLKKFLCDDCGFCSTHKGALNRHKRTHTDEKPYRCETCGQEYADSHKLKVHIQRHISDDKPFVCHLCAHSCRRRDNLQMHMKRIHRVTLDSESLQ